MSSQMTFMEYVALFRDADETKLRETEMPWCKSEEDLLALVKAMSDRQHDYGTCVYAMSLCAIAAKNLLAHRLGVTGFQASCADMDFLKRERGMKRFRICNYDNLLYPQYCDSEHFPSSEDAIRESIGWLSVEAARCLIEKPNAHPEVRNHWERLVAQSQETQHSMP